MVNKKEPNPKIAKAFQAMKDLGISQNKVKPVLRKLLSLYDKNWELIEEGNYRVLADAIFDNEEEEVEETPEKVADSQVAGSSMMIVYGQGDYMDEEDLEPEQIVRPLKRLRRKNHDGEDSSQRSSTIIPSPEVYAENRSELQTGTNDQNFASRAECSSPSVRRNIGNGSVSHQTPYSGRRFIPGALSFATTPRRLPQNHATPLKEPKDEPITEDVLLQNPLAIIHPDASKATEQRTSSPSEPILNGKPMKSSNESFPKLDIASSPAGEVKMSFSCNLALQGPDFQMPTSEEVLKLAEDKCIKSYKIIDPNFSLKGVMKGVCQCFLELASIKCPPKITEVTPASKTHEFVDVTPSGELPESLDVSLAIDLINRGTFSPVNGLVGPSLVEVQQPQVTPEIIRSGHGMDLTKGQENVVILKIDGNTNESSSSFHYIPNNMVFQKANVNFSLSCIGDSHCCSNCSGDCLSLVSPCACASGGEFAYTMDGLVKEAFLAECISMKCNPRKHQVFFCKECPLQRLKSMDNIGSCKGHVLKKFIKECWIKCRCHKQCGNRVVQRGISRNLQVFVTPEGKGWGLRSMVDLPKGAFICEYAGEILTATELFDRSSKSPKSDKCSYPVILDADWSVEGVVEDEDALGLDATHYGNVARFINHRCYDSNLVDIPVQIETPDSHCYYHVALFTTRPVKAMEELTWDYGIDFDDKDFPTKVFGCLCGSKFCRNK